MKNQHYSEMKDGKELRKVSISEEQAKRFNKSSKNSGLSYKAVKRKDDSTTVKIDEVDYSTEKVIEALGFIEVKKNKNTGAAKLQTAYDDLEDEQKSAIQEFLIKE